MNKKRRHCLVLMGTRPEAIKLFPVVNRLKHDERAQVTVCATAQHRELLDQVLKLANIVADIDLDIMRSNQSLDQLTARLLLAIGEVLDKIKPDRVIVQGDTATAMVGALAAYYRRIPVSHIEAGLRSGDIYAPWPEEVNRKIVATIADQHFAPTERAAERLRQESIPSENIFVTGNTVVDALQATRHLIEADPSLATHARGILQRQRNRRIVLVTSHRRENFGDGMNRIADALLEILKRPDIAIVLPLHPNPNVRDVLGVRLARHPQVELIGPQEYLDFVSLLSMAHIILTDSGGVQEEAPALGKPVLVMRDTTERPEGIEAGTARLVGTDPGRIVSEALRLMDDPVHYSAMARAHNPFGDGQASERIAEVILNGRASES
jgi:UDP-N-acetylglucosamine 2-epimerase (non-hydrolysing)